MISDAGLDLIIKFEGLKTRAYPDPATGGEPWTIGVGHTGNVHSGDVCTDDEAREWLKEDCRKAEEAIDELVDVELTQNQRDAVISLIFNIGVGNFRNSTLLKLMNSGNLDAAAKQFTRWANANGHPMAGLLARREAEMELFQEVA